MRPFSMVLVLVLVAACGADPDDGDLGGDAGAGSDADPNADAQISSCDPIPDPDTSWLMADITEHVSKLSGASEVSLGVTLLPDRASLGRRAAARDYIAAELEAIGLTAQLHDYGSGVNVYAELTADVATDEWILFGAHFDTVIDSPGANDNATGVAAMLAAARYMQTVSCRGTNIMFVGFDQEEIGLVGSAAFAAFLVNNGTDLIAAHTIDQAGYDNNDDGLVEIEAPDADLLSQYQSSNAAATLGMIIVESPIDSTDHRSFRNAGFDATGITEGFFTGDTTPHYHLPSDTFATVDLDYNARTAALVQYTLARAIYDPSLSP